METNKGIGRKSPCHKKREISERLVKERQEALKLMESQAKKTIKVPSKPLSNISSNKTAAKTASTSRALLGKKSPINKENLSTNTLQIPNKDSFAAPKAIFTLKKIHTPNMSVRQHTLLESNQTPTEFNKTEYVPRKCHEQNDISELLMLDSITLSGSSITTPKDATPNVSFNPNEMTGRSTLHKGETKRNNLLSIDDILMQSRVESVRERRKSSMGCAAAASELNSIASSCISNFSTMQKNPRPTSSEASSFAMPHSKRAGAAGLLFDDGVDFSFSQEIDQQAQMNMCTDESFAPAELMQSRLVNDEIEWAKEKLPIPTAKLLSKEAQQKLSAMGIPANCTFDSNSTLPAFGNGEMSVGQFFKMRSDDICNIVHALSPPRDRRAAPFALISDDAVTTTTTTTTTNGNKSNSPDLSLSNDEPLQPITPAIDDRTYDKTVESVHIRDSKDSGNATGKSSDPSVYAGVEKALAAPVRQNTQPIPSPNIEPLNGFVSALVGTANAAQNGNSIDFLKHAEQLQFETEKVLENKENIEAFNKGSRANAGSTTLSFTDSLLNTSIQNYRMSSVGQARAPLSPIPIIISELRRGDEADIDEFSNSPIALNRRKRFSKSPPNRNRQHSSTSPICPEFILLDDTDEDDVANAKQPGLHGDKNTALTDDTTSKGRTINNNVNEGTKETNSPKLTHVNKTPTPTPTHGNASGNSAGKHSFEVSPLSSPRSYLSSPLGSINGCQCSPNFDRTTNSDQRFLRPNTIECNGLRRVSSSPCASVASAPTGACANNKYGNSYGAPPTRTYSSNSVRSIETTSTRSVSRCSNNSEFTHRDGRSLPLKATALELSWGSIKLHKNSQKSMQIRNTSNKRLAIRMLVYGPGFQLIGQDNNVLTLTSQECRTIVINFCPTTIGPAIGKLSFQQPRAHNSNSGGCCGGSNEFIIPLYAYGGDASIYIRDILKGPLNVPFFPIGDLYELTQPLKSEFRIYNKGPLLGFAFVLIEPSGALHVPGLCSAFRVHPECTLLAPNTCTTIRLNFAPLRDELKQIKKIIGEVLTLAKMRIIYGDEAMRQRLRKIHNNMSANIVQREQQFAKSLDKLWTQIPGEQAFDGIDAYREETSIAKDIWSCLAEQEAAITLNNNMQDETAAELSTIFSDADNTILFRTVCLGPSPTQQLETLHEHQEESSSSLSCCRNTANKRNEDNEEESDSATVSSSTSGPGDEDNEERLQFAVLPESFEFNFLSERKPILLRNNFGTRQYFTVACNYPDLLYFTPSHGYIEANGAQLQIVVHAHPAARNQQQRIPNDINIMVYMDSKKIVVPVRVPS